MFDKKINLKTVIILILISILMASGTTYILAQTPTSTFTISPGIYPGAPSYTVWKEGNYYYAKDSTGAIKYSGIDAVTVIQNALNSLTNGRNWKEKVLLKGNIEISSTIRIPSYTILEIQGKIKASKGMAVNMIENNASMDHDFEIIGGTIDGNKDNGATNHAIVLTEASRWTIKSVRFVNVYSSSIKVIATGAIEAEDWIIKDCIFRYSRGYTIYLDGGMVKDGIITHNSIEDIDYRGIYIYSCWTITITDNSISINGKDVGHGHGIVVSTNAVGIIIKGNHIDHNYGHGIWLYQLRAIATGEGYHTVIIKGNHIHYNGKDGIKIENSRYVLIEGNDISENSYSASGSYNGITLVGTSTYITRENIIIGNTLCDIKTTPDQAYGIREYSYSDYNVIIGNIAQGNAIIDIWKQGSILK